MTAKHMFFDCPRYECWKGVTDAKIALNSHGNVDSLLLSFRPNDTNIIPVTFDTFKVDIVLIKFKPVALENFINYTYIDTFYITKDVKVGVALYLVGFPLYAEMPVILKSSLTIPLISEGKTQNLTLAMRDHSFEGVSGAPIFIIKQEHGQDLPVLFGVDVGIFNDGQHRNQEEFENINILKSFLKKYL